MKKQKGMTLVETIVAFAILMIAIALFYGSIQLSNKLISNQNQRRAQTEEMVNIYYLKDPGTVCDKSEENISFQLEGDTTNFSASIFSCRKIKLTKNDTGKELYYYEN